MSCYGSDTTDLISTAPGVAAVDNLTIPSPASATLTFNPGTPNPTETTHYVDSNPGTTGGAGACPGGSGTLTNGNQWYAEDLYFEGHNGQTTSVQGKQVVKVDSGWQPGSGNVVATRTISGSYPWLGAPGTPSAATWTDTFQIVLS
jgi:hypothetical protein